MNNKTLIVYFSHKGENYTSGGIKDLKKGNTEVVAELIAEKTGAALFELVPKKDYPFVYGECTDVAKRELKANSRPELMETTDVSGFDTIILGFPSWWGTMPMPVWTFLESQDFSGKTILPFCTNEGSGMGASEHDLKMLCPKSDIRAGLSIRGSDAAKAGAQAAKWLEGNA